MANNEPKMRTRTKTRGGKTITKTVTKSNEPFFGKKKTVTKEVTGPSGTYVKIKSKAKISSDERDPFKRKGVIKEYTSASGDYKSSMSKSKLKDKSGKTKYTFNQEVEKLPKETYTMKGKKVTVPEQTVDTRSSRSKTKSYKSKNLYKTSSTYGAYDMYGNPVSKPSKEKKRSR